MVSQCLIITGMHRSGTSLAAQIFYRAGLFMGDNLMEPSPNNPDGYFEDRDVILFHDEILKFNGIERWKSPLSLSAQLNVPSSSIAKAKDLIKNKYGARPLWGWKDPRTAWFLPFWKNIIPDAKFIFTYRRPEEVIWSLIRRGDYKRYSSSRNNQILLAAKHWLKTYRAILDFIKVNERSSFLLFIPDDIHNGDMRTTFIKVVRDIWGLPLSDLNNQINRTYKPRLLKSKVPSSIKLISKLYPPTRMMNNQIIGVHREMMSRYLQSMEIKDEGTVEDSRVISQSVISIVSPNDDLYSETFIQAHIDNLPAQVKSMYGYPLPNRTDEGEVLYPPSTLPNRIFNLVDRRILKVSNKSLHERAVKKFLVNNGVNLVLAEYGHTGVAMMEVCRQANIPLVVHFHGHDAYREKILNSAGKSYPDLFKFASALIVVSQDMRDQLIKLGASKNKIIVNPYGVDISQFRGADPEKAAPIVVTVGRFVDKKAPHLTLLAFREVLMIYPEARLIMIGDGPLFEACTQLAKSLCISHAVEFRGSRSHAEVAEVLRQSRVFAQHSIQTSDGDSEGTPVAVIEASATGLPVVATRHAGIKDVVIDGETGILIEEGDIDGMGQAMSQLLENPLLSARYGKKGRERVIREYSMSKSINHLWKTIETCIE